MDARLMLTRAYKTVIISVTSVHTTDVSILANGHRIKDKTMW